MLGLMNFKVSNTTCGLNYRWYYTTAYNTAENITNAIELDPPNALNASTQALCGTTSHLSTVFYIKTYKCQSPYVYYNATSDLCQDGCSDYFLANTATILC